MESATSANVILYNSKRPQWSAATKAAKKFTEIEQSPKDTLKKKSPAAFQLTNKVIPRCRSHQSEP
jgi:hypothetical protein